MVRQYGACRANGSHKSPSGAYHCHVAYAVFAVVRPAQIAGCEEKKSEFGICDCHCVRDTEARHSSCPGVSVIYGEEFAHIEGRVYLFVGKICAESFDPYVAVGEFRVIAVCIGLEKLSEAYGLVVMEI